MGEGDKDGKKEGAKCPKCDSDLHHVDKVGQHYCFSCETYYDPKDVVFKDKAKEEAPKAAQQESKEEELGKPKGIPCPKCGDMAAPVRDSDRFYCYTCEEFYTKGGKLVKGGEEEAPKSSATTIVDITEEKETVKEEPKASKESAEKETSAAASDDAEDAGLTAEETMILDILEGNNKGKKDDRRVCPTCGLALTYVQKYDRWYCYTCRKYAPSETRKVKEKGEEEEEIKCAYCGSDAEYIQKYDRWYCRSCRKYLPSERASAKEGEDADATPPLCSQCGKPTTWIAAYERHYCYPCKKYVQKGNGREEAGPAQEAPTPKKAPAAKGTGPACASCGQPTTYISKYDRHYCYPCQKYAPKADAKAEGEKPAAKSAKAKPTAPMCPNCKKPTTWIAKYERFYCYPCKKYVPKY